MPTAGRVQAGVRLSTRCEGVDQTTSCSASGSSRGMAGSRSGCSGTTTRSACSGPPASIRPADTASTGASQLAELNHVIALKELGFTLQQVQSILAEQVSAAEFRGMLSCAEPRSRPCSRPRRPAGPGRGAAADDEEFEARAPVDGDVIKRLAPVRVAELTAEAAGCGARGHHASHRPAVLRPVAADGQRRYRRVGPGRRVLPGRGRGRRRDRRARRRAGSRRGRPVSGASASWTCRPWNCRRLQRLHGDGRQRHQRPMPRTGRPWPVDRRQRVPLARYAREVTLELVRRP